MPRFHVVKSFAVESKSLFVLAGYNSEGRANRGMLVRVSVNSATSITAPIVGIEAVKYPGGREEVALCIHCSGADEFGIWRSMNLGGETIDVIEVGEEGPQ